MNDSAKIRLCIFIHYSISKQLPSYVAIYLKELSNHFDKIIVLSNNAELCLKNPSFKNNIDFVFLENRGYDFGMFYRFIKTQNLENFSQIAIVNDSNLLLNKLTTIFENEEKNNADFWGVIDSHEKPWFSTHPNNYHLQSHFIVLNKKAIDLLPEYLQQADIEMIMNGSDITKVRRLVINTWEIGLSQYFLKNGLKLYSIFSSEKIQTKYKTRKKNVANELYYQLSTEGYPFLKRKVILKKNNLFERKKATWQQTIREFMDPDWYSPQIIEELNDWIKTQN